MQKTAKRQYEYNIVQHYSLKTPNHHRNIQPKPKDQLETHFNIFILMLGGIIGGIIALFIAYQLNFNLLGYIGFIVFPLIMAILLYKIYNQTLLNIWNNSQ